ncbi:MAG: LysM peptidoglycan-binding domain-containing protein [Bacteroidetes bacterium]|nr:LysM peptidoglycan-binding domain-containing protein [Bacteroidota bacterium]
MRHSNSLPSSLINRLNVGFIIALLAFSPVSLFGQNRASSTTKSVKVLPPQSMESETSKDLSNRSFLEDQTPAFLYLEKLSTLYGYQSDIMSAEARNDEDAIVFILDLAISDLGQMLVMDDIVQDSRFSHIYTTLVGEYERVYGPSDTLFAAFGDIYDLRKAMFAELESVKDPLLEDLVPTGLQPVGTQVEMTMNRLVESSMEFLLQKRRDTLLGWLGRADTYFPMVEKIFAEEGIPDELKYLGMIESGLNPRARSWASAVGMWQFISATGRYYDLNVDAWVDDRMDPELATKAAAKHLKDLYYQYGKDWQIALAGYNCSPRCIKRAIARSGKSKPTYWDIYPYLPTETRNYVPTFIATSLIASNPETFGLRRESEGPQYAYSMVPVTGMIDLKDIAEMAKTDVATIKALNPSLRRESLPPSSEPFNLRIPVGSHDAFVAAFAELPVAERQSASEYIVKRGDTLSGVGSQFGVSVAQLKERNSLKSTTLRIGQRLVVPGADNARALPSIKFEAITENIVQYPRRQTRPIMMPTTNVAAVEESPKSTEAPVQQASLRTTAADTESKPTPPPAPAKTETKITYRVKSGDTLSGIADSHNVTIASLRDWNNLTKSRINSGQRLTIYTDGRSAPVTEAKPTVYRVKRGDTLSGIADSHNVTIASLRDWNNLTGSNLRVDQRITIRKGQSSVQTHTVRSGDTLIEIAQKYGTSVANLKEWNQLTSNTIQVGQQFKIFK